MKRIIQTGPAILICLLAAVNTAPAGLLEYTPYGSPAACYNSTGMALNLKGVAMAGQGLLANPALIAETDCLSAQITMGLNWRREYRSIEVFDSYANSVGLRTLSINDQIDYNLNSAEASYSMPFLVLPKIALGVGISREYDFNYRYKVEERDAFYYVTERKEQTEEGSIYGYSGALAVKPLSFLSIGLGLTRLSGDPTLAVRDNFEDPTYTDVAVDYKFNYKGNRFIAGILGQITPRIKLGVSWKSSSRVEGNFTYKDNDTTYSSSKRVGLPSTYVIGLNYRPTNEFPATVNLEYEHTPWQNLEDNNYVYDGSNANVYDCFVAVNRYSFGISHRMRSGLPLNFGVSFTNSYRSSSIGLSRAGFGTEIAVSKVKAGISAGVGRRTYNFGQALNISDGTTVSETVADLMLTFTLK